MDHFAGLESLRHGCSSHMGMEWAGIRLERSPDQWANGNGHAQDWVKFFFNISTGVKQYRSSLP